MKNYLQFTSEESHMELKAINLSGLFWKVPEGWAGFKAKKAYGVINGRGQVLSAKGKGSPATWHTMKIAKEIAKYAIGEDGNMEKPMDGNYVWLDVVNELPNEKVKKI